MRAAKQAQTAPETTAPETTPPVDDPLADALAALEQMQAALAIMEQMFAALTSQLALTRDLVEDLEDQLDDLKNPDPDPDPAAGRLIVSTDGNRHDMDDILSAPMSLALIAATGRQDELELMVYNDHIWDTDPQKQALMTESVLEGAERFDFDETEFISGFEHRQAAAEAIRDQINASSEENPLTILMAGSSHIISRGIGMSQHDKREYVTVVSHSNANETHAEKHGSVYTWDKILTQGVNIDEIPDQNRLLNTSESAWDWMEDNSNQDLDWVYDRNQKDNFDTSDSGMTYYYLTGDKAGTPAKFEDYLT